MKMKEDKRRYQKTNDEGGTEQTSSRRNEVVGSKYNLTATDSE